MFCILAGKSPTAQDGTRTALIDFYLTVASALHEQAEVIDKVSKAVTSKPLSADQRQLVKSFNVSMTTLLADLASKRPVSASPPCQYDLLHLPLRNQ